jgi:hypothetical protein
MRSKVQRVVDNMIKDLGDDLVSCLEKGTLNEQRIRTIVSEYVLEVEREVEITRRQQVKVLRRNIRLMNNANALWKRIAAGKLDDMERVNGRASRR